MAEESQGTHSSQVQILDSLIYGLCRIHFAKSINWKLPFAVQLYQLGNHLDNSQVSESLVKEISVWELVERFGI